MGKHRDLDTDDPFPASWTDGIQEFIGDGVYGLSASYTGNTLTFYKADSSATGGIGILGRWTWRTDMAVSVAHPGGAAGTYDVWAYCSEPEYSNTPALDTDVGDNQWYLRIAGPGTAITGNTPVGNPIFKKRRIGQVGWDGDTICWADLSMPLRVRPEDWITATLATGWTSSGSALRYYRHMGRVFLEGILNNNLAGTATTLVTTLPVGYRPDRTISWPNTPMQDFSGNGTITVTIGTDGRVSLSSVETIVWFTGLDFRHLRS